MSTFYSEPQSREILSKWLEDNGIQVHPALKIVDMDEGSGWMVEASARIPEGEICKPFTPLMIASKPSLLSPRTSSLYPLLPPALTHPPSSSSSSSSSSIPASTNHAILVFALCILHELRLGKESKWYGYLQSLPRPAELTGMLPVFWSLDDEQGGSEDSRVGLEWLQGTDASGDLRRREKQGMGLTDIRSFWNATSGVLSGTSATPSPPSFSDFTYAYTLLSTRAFVIDIYHHTALIPFADLFNHSAFPHTSLASDEFVCHVCGSMPLCIHDAVDMDRIPARLAHVHLEARSKLIRGEDEDTVEMRVEREIGRNQEVYNTYGEGMGDGRLAVEYGFIGEEYAGEGMRLDVEGLEDAGLRGRWYDVMRAGKTLGRTEEGQHEAGSSVTSGDGMSNAFSALRVDDEAGAASEDHLLYEPKSFRLPPAAEGSASSEPRQTSTISDPDGQGLYLSHAGQISTPLYDLIAVKTAEAHEPADAMARRIQSAGVGLECMHAMIRMREDQGDEADEPEPEPAASKHLQRVDIETARRIARAVHQLLQDRLASMHKPQADLTELFEQCDALGNNRPRTRMAMTLSINERVLLITAAHKWAEVLAALDR